MIANAMAAAADSAASATKPDWVLPVSAASAPNSGGPATTPLNVTPPGAPVTARAPPAGYWRAPPPRWPPSPPTAAAPNSATTG